jgi:purine-binding chemotaxis protein CheW
VIDLAVRLGWPATQTTPRNPIIVTEFEGQSRGLIVHDVNDIVAIDSNDLQQPDAVQRDSISNFLQGVAPLEEDMVMVLDLARLMASDDYELAA